MQRLINNSYTAQAFFWRSLGHVLMDLMFGVGGVITLTVNVNDESLDLKDNNILRTVGYNFFCLWADYNPAKYVCIALYVLA